MAAMMFCVLAVFATVTVLTVDGTNFINSRPFLVPRLLSCMNERDTVVLRPQRNDSAPNAVWLPVISNGKNQNQPQRRSPAEFQSLFSDSPGSFDSSLQMDDLPISNANDFIQDKVRVAGIDEVFPENSPFFSDTNVNATVIRDFIERAEVGQCPLVGEWTFLGERFYPRYFAGVRCEAASNCSIPVGLTCQHDFTNNPSLLYVLHWDCCHVRGRQFCGWKKVQIQVLSFCSCSCSQ